MKSAAEIGMLCRVATARMPTKRGMFNAADFERAANAVPRIDTALAMIMRDLRREAPLLHYARCVRQYLNLINRRAEYVNH